MSSDVDIVRNGEVVPIVAHEGSVDVDSRAIVATDWALVVGARVVSPACHEDFAKVSVTGVARDVHG